MDNITRRDAGMLYISDEAQAHMRELWAAGDDALYPTAPGE